MISQGVLLPDQSKLIKLRVLFTMIAFLMKP